MEEVRELIEALWRLPMKERVRAFDRYERQGGRFCSDDWRGAMQIFFCVGKGDPLNFQAVFNHTGIPRDQRHGCSSCMRALGRIAVYATASESEIAAR
jgi:hypothetical protein